jgi:hypothetical protein
MVMNSMASGSPNPKPYSLYPALKAHYAVGGIRNGRNTGGPYKLPRMA